MGTIAPETFIKKVEEIAAERPSYKLGHDGSDGLCDCIGLVRGALERAGLKTQHLRGTNDAARGAIRDLKKVDAHELKRGTVVLKTRDPDDEAYPLPNKYREGRSRWNGDTNNYTHIGVVTSVDPLRITHMTSPTCTTDKRLRGWTHQGWLMYVNDDVPITLERKEKMTMKMTVTSSNGKGVRLRASPGGDYIMQLPEGAEVEASEMSGGFARVSYRGSAGWASLEFLRETAEFLGENAQEARTDDTVTIQMPRTTAESLLKSLEAVIGVG